VGPQVGQDVIGADGEKVGEIVGVERECFIVRKGFFFPQGHYIPFSAIASYDEDKVYLNLTKEQVLEQQWTNPPAGYAEGDRLAGIDTDATERDTLRVPGHEEELTPPPRPS
jgi:hypothetical protein